MGTPEYRIRSCADVDVINGLQRKLNASDDLPILKLGDRCWWVAWHGKEPVAYAAMRVDDECAWFSMCGVVERHRGHGLQKRLIAARLRYARRQGVPVVYTYTINGNHPSARSLIRKRFVPCTPPARHYGCWAGVRDVLYWKCELR